MKKPYRDELKRLAEIERQINPRHMVEVELPSGKHELIPAHDYWENRDKCALEWLDRPGGVFLLMLATMHDEAYKGAKRTGDGEKAAHHLDERNKLLKLYFGEDSTIYRKTLKGTNKNE